jgi:hypothetical protein
MAKTKDIALPTINWDDLILLSDWANALRELLDAAERAIEAPDGPRQQVSELLRTFIKKSPIDAGVLDTLATRAITALNIAVMRDALTVIRGLNTELGHQLALIDGVTKQAQEGADKLKLGNLEKALKTAHTALAALKAANKALDSPDTQLTKKLDDLVSAIDNALK